MDIKLKIIRITLLITLILQTPSFAQSVDDVKRAEQLNNQLIQQFQQQQKAQQEQREQERPRTSFELKKSPQLLNQAEDPYALCFQINSFDIQGSTILSKNDLSLITSPFQGICLSLNKINQIIKSITLKYVELGYVTSRAYIPKQDLSKGILHITVVEGVIESFDNSQAPTIHIPTAFPNTIGNVFNLRDVEQGIEQLNRLSSNKVSMNLLPGKAVGATIIQLKNTLSDAWLGRLSVDNSGQESTGEYQGKLFLSLDNLFDLNDYASLNIQNDVFNPETGGSNNVSIHYEIPYGYWLFSLDANWYDYKNTIEGNVTNFESSGKSTSQTLKANYVLQRDQTNKTELNIQVLRKSNKNFIEKALLDTSSRTLSILTLGLSQQRYYKGNQSFQWSIGYKRGLPHFGAEESTQGDSENLEYNAMTASINYSTPFNLTKRPMSYATQWSMQMSDDELYGSEQFSIGSQYSVRGFNGESLSSSKGIFWRNDFSFPTALNNQYLNNMTPYIAFDVGAIKNTETDKTQQLSGTAVGIKFRGKQLSAELIITQAQKRPSSFSDDRIHHHLSLSYTF